MNSIKTLLILTKMDFKKRYLGTMLGTVWALLMPLVTIALIYVVLRYGLRLSGVVGTVSFVDWLVAGMLAWFFVSEGLGSGVGVIMDYPYLVTKMKFPVRLLIPARLCAAMPVHFLLMIIFMLVLAFGENRPFLCWLQLPYYFFCACVLVFSITIFTCAAQVFIRDIANVVGVFLQIFFWVTPLFWDPAFVKDTPFSVMLYSPFNYIVSGYRDALVHGVNFWNKPFETLFFWVATAICFYIGYKVFKRSRPHFADVL